MVFAYDKPVAICSIFAISPYVFVFRIELTCFLLSQSGSDN